jgi:hypothetical protein
MSIETNLIPVAYVALGVFLGESLAQVKRRYERVQALERANKLLDEHFDALSALDNDSTPVEVLELAISFSQLLQDPRTPDAITYALKQDVGVFDLDRIDPTKPQVEIPEHTPQYIVHAFNVAILSVLLAFTLRWPECERAFSDLFLKIAAAPVKQAARVVQITTKASAYMNAVPTAAMAA